MRYARKPRRVDRAPKLSKELEATAKLVAQAKGFYDEEGRLKERKATKLLDAQLAAEENEMNADSQTMSAVNDFPIAILIDIKAGYIFGI